MQNIEKAGRQTGFNQNEFFAGGKIKGFDAFDYAKNATEKQCDLCFPRPETKRGAVKFCSECEAKSAKLESGLFGHITQHRTIRRLHRCDGCGDCFAPEKFSIFYHVCKRCLRQAKDKSKIGRLNFIERTLNNFRRNLRGALSL